MKKIASFLIIVLTIAVAIIIFAIYKLITGPKAEIKSTTPYALKLEDRKAIYNSTGAVDYYVCINDKNKDRHLSAIYTFDIKAGTDFTKDHIKISSDKTTLSFPEPSVIVDQSDFNASLIINEKGKFDWNNELQPIKTALETMSQHYGRNTFPAISKKALETYLTKIDASYKYTFYEGSNYPKLQTINFPNCGVDFCFYQDMLKEDLRPCFDDCFTRGGVSFMDGATRNKIFRISFFQKEDCTSDKFSDWINERYPYSIRIIDPFNPNQKMIFTDKEKCIGVINGYWFMAEWLVVNPNQQKYLPYVLYLLSCLNPSKASSFSQNYDKWIKEYARCLEHINSSLFRPAKTCLDEMKRLQGGKMSKDEKYLSALVNAFNEDGEQTYTDDNDFNTIVTSYIDISKKGEWLKNSQSNRESFLQAIQRKGDTAIKPLSCSVENFFLRYCKCTVSEQKKYAGDIIEFGDVLDKSIIMHLNNELFHGFLKKVLHNSLEQCDNVKYTTDSMEKLLQPSENNNDHPNVYITMDCRKNNSYKDYYKDGNKDISDREIRDKIKKKAKDEELNKELSDTSSSPTFIILCKTVRKRVIENTDKDALVFTRSGMYFIPNYDGFFGDACKCSYEKLDFGSDMCELPNADYKLTERYIVLMCKKLKESYQTKKFDDNATLLKKELGNYIIKTVNGVITTVPHNDKPISLVLH